MNSLIFCCGGVKHFCVLLALLSRSSNNESVPPIWPNCVSIILTAVGEGNPSHCVAFTISLLGEMTLRHTLCHCFGPIVLVQPTNNNSRGLALCPPPPPTPPCCSAKKQRNFRPFSFSHCKSVEKFSSLLQNHGSCMGSCPFLNVCL